MSRDMEDLRLWHATLSSPRLEGKREEDGELSMGEVRSE
jgi:hypothetical protein